MSIKDLQSITSVVYNYITQ